MIEIVYGAAEWQAIAPVGTLVIFAMGILLNEAFNGENHDAQTPFWFSIIGLIAASTVSVAVWEDGSTSFGGIFTSDGVAMMTNLVACLAGGLSLAMALSHLEDLGIKAREVYPLVLFTVAGMMVMGAAQDLIVLFIGLEIMSIPAYVLAGLHRRDERSSEAALKYFLLGALASSFLLYGIALIYGATGSFSYSEIAAALPSADRGLVLGGIALLIVGLGFKVGVVPFHFWAPDVYQGAPTSITALMAVGIKAGAAVGMARLFLTALAPMHAEWSIALWVLSAATMVVGNITAIAQNNIKRMLAYSSVAHAGYVLAALVAGTPRGGAAILFYLIAYAFMNLGAFAVVASMAVPGDRRESISDYAGLAESRPILAGVMVIFLLSLMGIPPMAGFIGKLYIIEALVQVGYISLAVVLILTSVISGYYYLRVIMEMFMRDPVKEAPEFQPKPYLVGALLIALAGTIFFGVFPDSALDLARTSFSSLR
jgi:NADH-quinone oxidoreductase subunit N